MNKKFIRFSAISGLVNLTYGFIGGITMGAEGLTNMSPDEKVRFYSFSNFLSGATAATAASLSILPSKDGRESSSDLPIRTISGLYGACLAPTSQAFGFVLGSSVRRILGYN